MGLNICGIADAKKVGRELKPGEPLMALDQKRLDNGGTLAYINSHFPGRAGSIVRAIYSGTYVEGTCNSYSGYAHRRNQLAELANGKTDRYYWAVNSANAGPFWELICFSDCEGVIGPECCERLLVDFERFAKKAAKHSDRGFSVWYATLHACVKAVAGNGFLYFH